MKSTDLTLTRDQYNNSNLNRKGNFEVPVEYAKKNGWSTPYTEDQINKAWEMMKAAAFDNINAAHPQMPLTLLEMSDIQANTFLVLVLNNALIFNINNIRANGRYDINQTSSLSNSLISANQDANIVLTLRDKIDSDTEGELKKIQYFNWNLETDKKSGVTYVKVGNISLTSYTSLNNVFFSALKVLGVDPTILLKDEVEKLINNSVANAHKKIGVSISFTTLADFQGKVNSFNTGNNLTDTNGQPVNQASVEVGDVIIFTPQDQTLVGEEVLIDINKHMIQLTSTNLIQSLMTQINSRTTNLENGKLDKTETTKFLHTDRANGSTQMAAGYEPQDDQDVVTFKKYVELISELLNQFSEIRTNIVTNTNSINSLEPRVAANEIGVADYYNSKSSFVTVADTIGVKTIDVSNINWVENGNNLTLTFTTELGALTDNQKVELTTDNDLTLFDIYNNNQASQQVVNVNDQSVNTTLNTTPTTWTLTGLNQAQRTWLIANGNPKLVLQLATTVVSGIDTVARTTATQAQATATAADALSKSNKSEIDLVNGIPVAAYDAAGAIISQNLAIKNQFDPLDPLKQLMKVGDMDKRYALKNGTNINVGAANAGKIFKVGPNGNLILQVHDLSDVKVDPAFAGKIIQVKADGTLEYITMSALITALGLPTRKDITATYATRKWNVNDAGKKVYITHIINGVSMMNVGFISEGADTAFIDGGAVVDLGINFTDDTKQQRLFWSTESVSTVGYIDLYTQPRIGIGISGFNITKFEIEE